ncbi:hypothetical protein [Gordonia spumicola]|uniref:hypothetical protein n=1 Tax=Gordonia spumicola TaxID=589161 RepID=UPI00137AAA65|nr:hypothetical protein [Gordonia spumicola]
MKPADSELPGDLVSQDGDGTLVAAGPTRDGERDDVEVEHAAEPVVGDEQDRFVRDRRGRMVVSCRLYAATAPRPPRERSVMKTLRRHVSF